MFWLSSHCNEFIDGGWFLAWRRAAYAVVLCLSVGRTIRLPFCRSQAGIVSKLLDESSWFLARMLPFAYTTLCYKKVGYLKLWTLTIMPRQFDRVANKTRQRSSLLTTPTTVDTSCTLGVDSLLQVGRPKCFRPNTSICCGFAVRVPSVVQQLTRFRLK